MNVQKRNRLIAAGTVTVVLLLVVLVAILIYQLVAIVNLNNRKQQLQEEYEQLIEDIDQGRNDIEYYSNLENLFEFALGHGMLD